MKHTTERERIEKLIGRGMKLDPQTVDRLHAARLRRAELLARAAYLAQRGAEL